MTIPDCGDPNCTDCQVVWDDGKRYVKCGHETKSYDAFVVSALTALLHDVAIIKALVAPRRDVDHSGLVP